jgi:hypothetical protein
MKKPGFSLVELLVAMTITIMLMAVVMQVFDKIGRNVAESRATLELCGKLRATAEILQQDLQSMTVTPIPPRDVDDGYLEIVEGPIGPLINPSASKKTVGTPPTLAINSDVLEHPENYQVGRSGPLDYHDYTVIDNDDYIMFTARSTSRPFRGKCQWKLDPNSPYKKPLYVPGGTVIESNQAEIAWFIRGRTLYRRVMLIAPWINSFGPQGKNDEPYGLYCDQDVAPRQYPNQYPVAGIKWGSLGFYEFNDISVRNQNNLLVANSLADLARRECRYAHDFMYAPYKSQLWGSLGLPTLRESSSSCWITGKMPTINAVCPINSITNERNNDYWIQQTPNLGNYPYPWIITPGDPDPSAIEFSTKNTTYSLSALAGSLTSLAGFTTSASALATMTPLPLRDGYRTDDIILDNVIGFDVKVWDPLANGGLGDYVDLGYANSPFNITSSLEYSSQGFGHVGDWRSNLDASATGSNYSGYNAYRVYDTWTTYYMKLYGRTSDGFDSEISGNTLRSPNSSRVNNQQRATLASDTCLLPPYPSPLRGIKITIRAFDPDSRQIREVTVIQDFLPK